MRWLSVVDYGQKRGLLPSVSNAPDMGGHGLRKAPQSGGRDMTTNTHQKDAERISKIRRLIARKQCLGVSDAIYLLDSIPFLLLKLEQGTLGLWESN